MKFKPFVIPVFSILILFVFGLNSSYAQNSFYIVDSDERIYEVDIVGGTCNVSLVTQVNNGGQSITDIAVHPDGTLYGITSSDDLFSVNLNTGNITQILNIIPPTGELITSLISAEDGTLYAVDRDGLLYDIDVNAPSFNVLGTINAGNGASGDLTFNNGVLYMSSNDNTLVEVNIENPSASTEIASFSGGSTIFGIVSIVQTCNLTTTYALSNSSEIFTVNVSNGQMNEICDIGSELGGNNIFGAAAPNEFAASSCILECDFNGSNPGTDNSVSFNCSTPSVNILNPAIAELTSSSNITQITLTLGNTLNGSDESIEFDGSPPLGIAVNTISPAVIQLNGDATPQSFIDAIAMISYNNVNDNPTTGVRNINFSISNKDGESSNGCSVAINVECTNVTVNVDLDNANLVETGNDYSGTYNCNTNGFNIAPDPRIQPNVLDSIVIEITAGIQDIGDEILTVTLGGANLDRVFRKNGTVLVIFNTGGATNNNFIQALRNIKYVNNATPKSKGTRRIVVTGKLDDQVASTLAICEIEIVGPDAGKFNDVSTCLTGAKINLFDNVIPAFPFDPGGEWTNESTGNPLISGTDEFDPFIDQQGKYIYTVEDACSRDSASLFVTVENPATFDAIPDEAFFCTGSNIVLNAATAGAASYKWSLDRGGNNVVNNGSSYTIALPGLYYVTVDLNGCILVDSTNVFENPVGELDVRIINPDTSVFVLCDDQSVSLTANTINPPSNDAIVYKWSTGSNETTITVDDKGIYSVTAKQGCDEGSDDIRIELENCRCPVFVPNAFSPLSAASINSSFYPITDSCATMIESNLSIFNRWGEKIHEGGENNPWRGGDFPLDTYAWHFTYSYRSPIDENQVIAEELKGFVILIK